MKVSFRVLLFISLLLNLFLVSSYRDSAQIANNYTYQPAVIPTGIVNKIGWGDTWTYFKETTLTKVLCQYRKTQVCDFTLPANAPKNIVTNFYTLQVSEKQLSTPANSVASLASLDNGNLVIARRNGDLYNYDPVRDILKKISSLSSNESKAKLSFIKGPLSGVNEALGLGIRDIFIDQTSRSTTFYYTYTRVDSSGCLSMNFESVELDNQNANQNGWKNRKVIWSTENECLRFSEAHILGAGGKIEKLSKNQFLISLGDLNLIDNRLKKSVWGNILMVNSETRKVEIFTRGHRNPSGMTKILDGRIFQVEQGPQGGDEINQLELGSDYGWPTSSFGRNYTHGGYAAGENTHEFGREPLMAFVPSPAFSSIATFPKLAPEFWTNSKGIPDLFISSLKGNSIYRCRLGTTNGDINYCERIFLRERLRDLVLSQKDNEFQIYVLTDRGALISMTVKEPVRI
jgi:glucose/arabinose dehydrogenase